MADREGERLRRRDHAAAVITDHCWPARAQPRIGSIGLEVELLPMRMANDGRPAGRVRLDDVARWLDDYAPQRSAVRGPPGHRHLPGHGTLTFEPGGQLEYSTLPHPTAADALDDLDRVCGAIAGVLGDHGVALASAGMDIWHPLASVDQQLRQPRYRAMHDYFRRRGGRDGPGALMMRHTCALQINLDLGGPDVASERWLLANLLSPLVTATFASSPTREGCSGRSLAWQRLDPTRTGIPASLAGPPAPVIEHLTATALHADVLCLPTTDGGLTAGQPGFSFADWMRDGHPRLGRPTARDLVYHLTTVWPDVRTRGFLEIRGIDALPARWRAAPVALLSGLLYDDRARTDVLGLLLPHRRRLPALAQRAARHGLADPALHALATAVWSHGARAAHRLPPGWLKPHHLATCARYVERFVERGRCPADELRAHMARAPAQALAWAREPAGSHDLAPALLAPAPPALARPAAGRHEPAATPEPTTAARTVPTRRETDARP